MTIYPLTLEILNKLPKGIYALFQNGVLSETIEIGSKHKIVAVMGDDWVREAGSFLDEQLYKEGKWEIVLASEITLQKFNDKPKLTIQQFTYLREALYTLRQSQNPSAKTAKDYFSDDVVLTTMINKLRELIM